jgi:fibronectin-binding autotransporter adhesin
MMTNLTICESVSLVANPDPAAQSPNRETPMTVYLEAADVNISGTRVNDTTAGDHLIIKQGVAVATSSFSYNFEGGVLNASVLGIVSPGPGFFGSTYDAIRTGKAVSGGLDTGGRSSITIGQTGLLAGPCNMRGGDNAISNQGTINSSSSYYAIRLGGGGNSVNNSGMIIGGIGAQDDEGVGGLSVVNSGSIAGRDNNGIAFSGSTTPGNTNRLNNSGSIDGRSAGVNLYSYNGLATSLEATNSGTITGSVDGFNGAQNLHISNSGNISGGTNGVKGLFGLTVDNSGHILGSAGNGITFTGGSSVTIDNRLSNRGDIQGGLVGVEVDSVGGTLPASLDATNSGTISGGVDGIKGGNNLHITNSGSVIGGTNGVNGLAGLIVDNSGQILGSTGNGLNFSGGSTYGGENRLANRGDIRGGVYGIRVATAIGDSFLNVVNSGNISGIVGISAADALTVQNSGAITGTDGGILARTNISLTNSGTVSGKYSGAVCQTGGASIVNSGTLSATHSAGIGTAIDIQSTAVGLNSTILNLVGGMISVRGTGDAIRDGDGVLVISNHGEIIGTQHLNGGNDIYEGSLGIASGTIFAGVGNDVITGGAE